MRKMKAGFWGKIDFLGKQIFFAKIVAKPVPLCFLNISVDNDYIRSL